MTAPDPRPGGCLHGPRADTLTEELFRFLHDAGDGGVWEHFDAANARAVAEALTPFVADAVAAARTEGRAEQVAERLRWHNAVLLMAARAEVAERRLAEVEGKVRALAEHWAGCWCGPQESPDHDPRRQDCPRHGDGAAAYFSEGIVSGLRALVAQHRGERDGGRA